MIDLDEAIRLERANLEEIPKKHPDQMQKLSKFGDLLSRRYSKRRMLKDVEEAIEIRREIIDQKAENDLEKANGLNELGMLLRDRYWAVSSFPDVLEAIKVTEDAMGLVEKPHADWVNFSHNLGLHLGDRFIRSENLADLDKAIQLLRDATEATPKGDSKWARSCDSLAFLLSQRYEETGQQDYLEEAVTVERAALEAVEMGNLEKTKHLNTMVNILGARFLLTEDMVDLDEAIRLGREAVALTPDDHPDLAKQLNNLALRLWDKYITTLDKADLKEAILNHQLALNHRYSPASARVYAGRTLVSYCANLPDWKEAYEASKASIELIQDLNLQSLCNVDRQEVLSEITELAVDGIAAAANANLSPLAALSLLEQGRCIIASSIQNTQESPSEHMGHEKPNVDSWKIPTEEEMKEAARYGPIVIVNGSDLRCDAILLEHDNIRLLPLPDLTLHDISQRIHEGELSTPETLSWLWNAATRPVLDALGFHGPPSNGKWPRIWWIPTGEMSKFPFHAAGNYSTAGQETVLDRAISSYSSSIKAIIRGRREPSVSLSTGKSLLIAMEHTPGSPSLPFAAKEVSVVQDVCKSMALDPIQPIPRKKEVLSHLTECKIFHFAGHGRTSQTDPLQSQLLLTDAGSDPLTVGDLLELELHQNSPFLAYLSACGTGRIKEMRFVDEAVHLISSCQLAGFRHVVGTLWVVNDELCVDFAKITYEAIVNGGMTDESVSQGLHDAARHLRDRWLKAESVANQDQGLDRLVRRLSTHDGEPSVGGIGKDGMARNAFLIDEEDKRPMSWVPYVHFGV